ncbi:Asp-tRNA(Asn)/Glu-tRNA(Gln) amidotransferase subunit GatC [Basilea psittacipulmonis]|uniref:Aspartyl/glutamyl-tRNA(Asn/Gln) amidotransferase subunit C n=1 Tax=Basilea psittacipulmonis DSM 24701 TaxID=1072685 RepID=A0A077DD61_9BURK|nr:Asp-tRNA(Asn)/Glu-tRNA(Gln) amidotransferase subunit GatC [Basilea psittacipulmonis]AIL32111.1 glutamyl-tRNA amidotransferase [Basilea psittacipulmonis DSM 24701]
MALNLQDITRIAKLARLELDEHTKTHMLDELNSLMNIIEKLQSVDTTGVEPLSHPLSAHEQVALRLREDKVTESSSIAERDLLMKNAPATENGLFLVPKVIE